MDNKKEKEEKKEVQRKKPKKQPTKFPWFMPFMCEGCGDCIDVCPNSCIELRALDRKVPRAWLIFPEYCIGCGQCVEASIIDAVQMTEYVDKAIKRYKEKKEPFE